MPSVNYSKKKRKLADISLSRSPQKRTEGSNGEYQKKSETKNPVP